VLLEHEATGICVPGKPPQPGEVGIDADLADDQPSAGLEQADLVALRDLK